MIREITSESDWKQILHESCEKLVVVDFYAVWCGPCKVVAPHIEKYSEMYGEVIFCKLDVDKLGSIAQENGISAMPTFLAFRDGHLVGSVRGADPSAVEKLVQKHKFTIEPTLDKTHVTGGELLKALRRIGVDTRGYLEKHELIELAEEHGLFKA
mmetsp:Transcript_11411/g.11436  ORF Transcript_11411/g.11436 Transcript_11411/m.11436 type:complete len:155 (-) Transcript_11411:291-755(-)|eukprot:CAMPEP_0182444560 /NCGR_PEP_ID=MMETSP1172-20130603/2973_1 /TAXON_ID=708627 /ORGANISM="Timspurckia oligopyrenoides, Strain CCMP3278" /LENGTH=154 /DNA_ID=CAMNT_0024640141 /DNA_START=155 /DNA_END=619 /DNA_ORIENTATION=-